MDFTIMNIVVYVLIFAAGFLVHKFFFANHGGQGSKG